MGYIFSRKKTSQVRLNSGTVPLAERMEHEVLIDMFRAICKHYSIKFTRIARILAVEDNHVHNILKKKQYARIEEFADMCEALKLCIKSRSRSHG